MCFSIGWLVQIIVWVVILSAVAALVRIWLLPLLAAGDTRIAATVNILIWVAAAIFLIYVIADLLICAVGGVGVGLPPHIR